MVSIQFNDQYGNTIKRLTQWDSNVILAIPNFKYGSAPVFHFNNGTGSTSITVTSVLNEDTVSVVMPNILFTRAKPIEVFVFLYDSKSDEGRTIYQTTIPVAVKPKPDDYEYIDNTEIIEITSLGIRLQALIDEAERSINVHIKELEDSYNNTIQTIRQSIADDVTNLNQSISNNRDVLERDISNNLQTILSSIDDGTPKGIFSDVSELANKSAGIYLYINGNNENNGYVYYWDGTNLSDRLIYYQGTVLNDGVVVYSNLSAELKKLIKKQKEFGAKDVSNNIHSNQYKWENGRLREINWNYTDANGEINLNPFTYLESFAACGSFVSIWKLEADDLVNLKSLVINGWDLVDVNLHIENAKDVCIKRCDTYREYDGD